MLNGGSWGSKVQHQATENPVLRSIQRRCSKVETETAREGGDEAQDSTELAEDAGENQGEAEGAKQVLNESGDAVEDPVDGGENV